MKNIKNVLGNIMFLSFGYSLCLSIWILGHVIRIITYVILEPVAIAMGIPAMSPMDIIRLPHFEVDLKNKSFYFETRKVKP